MTQVTAVFIFVLFLSVSALCQRANSWRYPNELRGFELMKTSKLKTLIPGVSTERDVLKIVGEECRNRHKRLDGVCELDRNWYVSFGYDPDIRSGILWSIEFYPRKRIPFSRIKFPKIFERDEIMIVHLGIEVDTFKTYGDSYGLKYVIVNQAGDDEFRKGDLFYIEYGLSER